jgi:hypothetical protein
MLYNICMKLKAISTKSLALKQRTGTGQHQDICPVSCCSPEPDNMFSLQPRVLAVGRKSTIFQKLKTELRKQTGNTQACYKLLKAFLNTLNVLVRKSLPPLLLRKSLVGHVYSRLTSRMEDNLLKVPCPGHKF